MIHKTTNTRTSAFFALVALFAFTFVTLGWAQTADQSAEGFIEGRVFNAATGNALESARVSVEGTNIFAMTDAIGFYHIGPIAPGEKRLIVTYTGLVQGGGAVTVEARKRALKDFELTVPREAPRTSGDDVVVLEKFTVVSDRELSAQALAMNERKTAGNIKNVVAMDEFGYVGDENVGEFFRYLPGVAVQESGDTPTGISLRGIPAEGTNIQIDGADIAAGGDSRAQNLMNVPMSNISRIEVTKVPTPDMSANALGGSVNLISNSGFIRRTPKFDYSLSFAMLSSNIGIDGGTVGTNSSLSPKFQQPAVSLSYILPVSRNLAFTARVSRTWRNQPMDEDRADTDAQWNYVTNVQRESRWQALAHLYKTWEAQFGVSWRVSRSGMLTANIQRRHQEHELLRCYISVGYGGGGEGDSYYTQSSVGGGGTILQGNGSNQNGVGDTTHSTLKYTHTWSKWKLETLGSWSAANNKTEDISNGYFNTAPSRIQGALIRGEGIGEDGGLVPVRYSATVNGEPVDMFSGENYVIGKPTSKETKKTENKYIARADLSRDFFWDNVTGSIKIGGLYDLKDYEHTPNQKVWTFTPVGIANLASNFDVFDQNFNENGAPAFGGKQFEWISVRKLYELYLQKPAWFPVDYVETYKANATASKEFSEEITAGYVRGDLRLFSNRLWIVAGARYERTVNDSSGMLNDPNAPYMRGADGKILIDAANAKMYKPEANTTEARNRLIYGIRGAHIKKSYDGIYPSINASYNITPDIVVRAAYARTIGRPTLTEIVPGMTINTTGETDRTINLSNPNLIPWTGDGYDLMVEFYGIKGAQSSVGIFQKNMSNFFEAHEYLLDAETAEMFGVPWTTEYDENKWYLKTRNNGTRAKIVGYEFSWSQKLFFLPHWARGVRVYVNATKLDLSGSAAADFKDFSPANYSGGIDLIRSRYSIKMGVTYQGETKTGVAAESAGNGIPKDQVYNYRGEALKIRLNIEYNFSKHFVVYASFADIQSDGNIALTRRYASYTPEYARDVRRQDLGRTYTIGVKGTF